MFDSPPKSTSRRTVIRDKCPDRFGSFWRDMRASGAVRSLGIAAVFCGLAISILMLRENVVAYRPGQYVPQDVISRVNFIFPDKSLVEQAQLGARESELRIYKPAGDVWNELQTNLLELPDKLAGKKLEEINTPLRNALELDGNSGALGEFSRIAESKPGSPDRAAYEMQIKLYINTLKKQNPLILPEDEYRAEQLSWRRKIAVPPLSDQNKDETYPASANRPEDRERFQELRNVFERAARPLQGFSLTAARIVAFTLNTLKPTYVLDAEASADAQNRAARQIPASTANHEYKANQPIVSKGVINEHGWQILKAEKEAFVQSLGFAAVKAKLGLAGMVVLVTAVMAVYVGRFQPRIVRNHARGIAIAGLLLSMLLLDQLAAIGTGPLYVFGLAPTILVAMILAIVYDQRFAIGIATMHGILVTAALDQGIGFFLILWVGVLTCGFLIDEIRTRHKLIEIGGATALAMILATIASGAVAYDPAEYILQYSLYSGAAGLSCGFIVLGILPFIEKAFKITTSMSLLELADASHPLLRRLAVEAPGTYNHSLQVATLSEAAAEAIGGNSLLTRVAAYYHDVGKINKADYFVENQTDGRNRHIHLSPNMSFHIITGHVKDGMALAKEYNLPTVLLPFIQQHHGTTLIEYFFDKARKQHDQSEPEGPQISEMQFRYNGPKPKSKEIAILMLADAAESASRTLEEPTASAIERLVHNLAMKRLLDGQFDECDLTMRDLELVERALVKTLTGIYHGRIAYPASANTPAYPAPTAGRREDEQPFPSARTA